MYSLTTPRQGMANLFQDVCQNLKKHSITYSQIYTDIQLQSDSEVESQLSYFDYYLLPFVFQWLAKESRFACHLGHGCQWFASLTLALSNLTWVVVKKIQY